MKNTVKSGKIAALITGSLFLSACFRVQVIRHVDNPDVYFANVHRQIEKIERENPQRLGRAHDLCLFVYEHGEDQIIKLTIPLWIVNLAIDAGQEAAENDREWRKWKSRYDLDWDVLHDLGQFGPGLLVAVDDEQDKVLIWLK
jgi:hypothetical protein